MIETLKAAWNVLQAGGVVADPAKWKKRQISANQLAGVFGASALFMRSIGYDLHLDDATTVAVAGGVLALVNWLLTVITTDKVGAFGGTAGGPSAGEQGPLDSSLGSLTPDAAAAIKVWRAGKLVNPQQPVGPQGDGP
jgi:hypothetical protein